MKTHLALALAAAVGAFATLSLSQPAQAQQRREPPPLPAGVSLTETTKIADGVYSFRYRGHRSLFVTTSEGVIVTDPINTDAAPLMMKEIRKLTAQPIKYMLYSHEHRDHASGGRIFKDAGAQVISHEKCVAELSKNPDAVVPDVTFKDRHSVTLGGKTIEMMHFGTTHSPCTVIMRLPQDKLLFAVDTFTPKSVLHRFIRGNFFNTLAMLKEMQNLGADRVAPGHGPAVAPISAVADTVGYMEELLRQTKNAMSIDPEVEAVKKLVDLSEYNEWRNAAQDIPRNIEGMFRILSSEEGKGRL